MEIGQEYGRTWLDQGMRERESQKKESLKAKKMNALYNIKLILRGLVMNKRNETK